MVLLVDDDAVTVHIATGVLTGMRRAHRVARSAADALVHVARHPIDLLILEVHLPDRHGLDLATEIGERPHLQDVPVLLCTSDASAETVTRAQTLGVFDYLRKPISVDAFADRVTRALRHAPPRWEPWPETVRRLRVDRREFDVLLRLTEDALASLVAALAPVDGAPRPATDEGALMAHIVRVRGAALQVGAMRTVQMIDYLWPDPASPAELAALHDALVVELSAIRLRLGG